MTLRKLQNYVHIGLIVSAAILTFIATLNKMDYGLFIGLLIGVIAIAMIIFEKYGKCKSCGKSLLARRGVSPSNTKHCPNC